MLETINKEIVATNADLSGCGYGEVEGSQITGTNLQSYEWKRERVGNSTYEFKQSHPGPTNAELILKKKLSMESLNTTLSTRAWAWMVLKG